MNVFPPPEQMLNPFHFYAQMRKFHPIVYDDKNKVWGIFRYDDIQSVLTNYKHFSSDFQKLINIQQVEMEQQKQNNKQQGPDSVRRSILTSDPPYHNKLRSVISSAFTSTTIGRLKPRIEEISHDMIDKVIENGSMDLINDLAYPLPVTVIAELLGIPSDDRDTFKRWADELIGSTTSSNSNLPIDKASEQIFKRVQTEMDSYFINIIEKRKVDKVPSNDLISNLLKAEMDGNKLTEDEILAFCSLLLLAGHVTTVNLIGNIIRSLLDNPKQLEQLLVHHNGYIISKHDSNNHPLISSAIEETLRYRSPVQALIRFAAEDIVIGEQRIERGQRLIIWIGSANRDESIFDDAEKFDINRSFSKNAHLAFGYGIHFCLGSALASLEAQVVLKVVLDRLKNMKYPEDYKESLRPLYGIFFHGVKSLPLTFKPAKMRVKSR
ncbi:MAG TPA: cytochrome P450 [Nitrososphaeraceae archaeon]